MPDAVGCPHCGTATEDGGFCCSGCEAAAALIEGVGLERYYADRLAAAPRPQLIRARYQDIPTVVHDDGTQSVQLVIDGFTCTSCTWVTESVLAATPGVSHAQISYASGRARLRWDPEETNLDVLCQRVATLGYRPRALAEAPATDRGLLARLGGSAFLAVNVMMLAAVRYADIGESMDARFLELFHWTELALATPIALWAASPFFEGARQGLRHRVLHMDTPIALAVALLFAHGAVATLVGAETYLDSMAMLVTLLLAGRVLEARSRRRSADAASSLAAQLPRVARRVRQGAVHEVPAEELEAGDEVEVGAGEEVPADGLVVAGSAEVAMALLTGESEPVEIAIGSAVVGGAVVRSGSVRVRVERAGKDALVHRMADELRAAADRFAPSVADRAAPWFTAATLIIAGSTFGLTFAAQGVGEALARTVAVLVVACPCALALSEPVAASAGLGAAARRGLLLRSPAALLALADVDTVALDKTGTVTEGVPRVVRAEPAVLRIAAGLARSSGHPVSRALVAEAARRGIPLPASDAVHETAGEGLTGLVDGRTWSLRRGGPGRVALVDDTGAAEEIALADVVRGDAGDAVAKLRGLGMHVALISGDRVEVATRIGQGVGADEIVGGATPEAKVAWIADRQANGHRVLFVGDGLNDGPALTAADVGVAMSAGVASSLLAADGVTATDAVSPLVVGLRAARATRRAVRANLARSLVYNITAVAAAAGGLVNPLVAAVLMPLSSLMVVLGSTRIERSLRRDR